MKSAILALTFGSAALTLAAWVLPIMMFVWLCRGGKPGKKKNGKVYHEAYGVAASIAACAASLLLQMYTQWMILQSEWTACAAYLSTSAAAIAGAVFAITLLLNVLVLLESKRARRL